VGEAVTKRTQEPAKTVPESRDEHGRFRPGCSGNPGGRPGVADEILDLARADSPDAYAKVKAIMQEDGHKQQLAAALAILKVAGVFRAVEEAPQGATSKPNAYAAVSTEELLRRATVSSTLPQ
jgi:hypothetical protein